MNGAAVTFSLAGPDLLGRTLADGVAAGGRFVGLFAKAAGAGTALRALLETGTGFEVVESHVPAGMNSYQAVTPLVPAAAWYERVVHDLFGLVPEGHPGLDPLVLPLQEGAGRPRPGRPDGPVAVAPDLSALPPHVRGEGVFTIPYGPVRSGVFEAVEYLVETSGEDIPRVRVRPYVKHRGVVRRFTGLRPDGGVLLAERVEGTLSVAHACAFCQAVETLAEEEAPTSALLLRLIHAELERIANHLDSMLRHTEAAGQAVAAARLGVHKERIMRFRAGLCGHRFGRGVVVPGGVTGPPKVPPAAAASELAALGADLALDLKLLMTTPSFLDRLRSTGPLPADLARSHGAVGPVGRASGAGSDARLHLPYGAYPAYPPDPVEARDGGDALARQWVRIDEVVSSVRLARAALDDLAGRPDGPWLAPCRPDGGTAVAAVESPHGELVYVVTMADGLLADTQVRTASFHNLALFPSAFAGDIFTDFAFIEASFGLNMAGVAG